jgi:Tfp pilus assembly protein PilN
MKIRLNLALREYRRRRWIRLALNVASILLLSLLIREGMLYKRLRSEEADFQLRIERIRRQQDLIREGLRALGKEPTEESFKTLRKEVAFANDLIFRKTFSWTEFLSDLEARVPPDVAVGRIQPSFATGMVLIGGTARSLKELTRLIIQLQSDPTFEDVFLLDQKVDPNSPVKDAVEFSIQFRYRERYAKS